MTKKDKIYIAGHRGLVGSAILKNLIKRGFTNIVTRTHNEVDLTNQQATADFFAKEKPDYVFLAAAKVGGIVANNTYRADFIYHNLMIQNNVIHASYENDVKKLLFLGSTCIYPKNAEQPIKENSLLTDVLEYTNEPYAIAKIAGIKLCESYNLQHGTNFISVMPTNLYGPNDNFDLEKSHVLPALIRKIYLAKALSENNWKLIKEDLKKNPIEGVSDIDSKDKILAILSKYGVSSSPFGGDAQSAEVAVEIWGSGKPMREFLYSEDMADACVHVMQNVDFKDLISSSPLGDAKGRGDEVRNTHINIGTGEDITIKDLANLIKKVIGFTGDFVFNTDKPDGTMRKVTDVSKLHALGWKHTVELEKGVKMMYDWYLENTSTPKDTTVITYGTFDLFHYGHIEILKRASKLGTKLIVGLSTDDFNKIKGKKCEIPYAKRKELLEAIEYVDLVIPEDDWAQKVHDIKEHNAAVFVMGDDWKGKFDELNKYCKVIYLPRTVDISTTRLKTAMNKNNNKN